MVLTCDEMREEKTSKKMLHTNMEGKRPKGSPKTRWKGKIG